MEKFFQKAEYKIVFKSHIESMLLYIRLAILAWFSSISLFSATNSHAGDVAFKDAIEMALDYSPELQVLNERLTRNDLELDLLDIQNDFRFLLTTQTSTRTGLDLTRSSQSNSIFFGLGIDKIIYDFGRLKSQKRTVELNTKAQEQLLIQGRNSKISEASRAYLEVTFANEALLVRKSSRDILSKQLRGAELRFEIGDGTKTDVALAKSRLASTEAGLLLDEKRLKIAELNFEIVFGFSPSRHLHQFEFSELKVPKTVEKCLEQTALYNPSIQFSNLVYDTKISQISEVNNTFKPTLSMRSDLSYRINSDSLLDNFSPNDSLGLSLTFSVPILNGREKSVSKKIKLSEANIATFEIRRQLLETERAVKRAWITYSLAKQKVDLLNIRVGAAELAFEGAMKELELGLRTQVDTLNAEQELLESKLSVIEADKEISTAVLDLLEAIGIIEKVIWASN